jgi:hypothetical protein
MNAVDTHQKRLRNEVAAVEKEIQSHNQQVAALNQRLEGLKRAVELFASEQSAMVELLRTNPPLAEGLFRDAATRHRQRLKMRVPIAMQRLCRASPGR